MVQVPGGPAAGGKGDSFTRVRGNVNPAGKHGGKMGLVKAACSVGRSRPFPKTGLHSQR